MLLIIKIMLLISVRHNKGIDWSNDWSNFKNIGVRII